MEKVHIKRCHLLSEENAVIPDPSRASRNRPGRTTVKNWDDDHIIRDAVATVGGDDESGSGLVWIVRLIGKPD